MKTYKLNTEQTLNAGIDKVWDFFSSPENLDELTPDNMGFEITSSRPIDKMYQGQIIEYKVSPLFNIPLHWKTLITEVSENEYFVDEQTKGPYSYWRHKHIFIPIAEDKTLMKDELEYALPLGILGRIAHQLYVKNRLTEIFDYRYLKVESLFNGTQSESIDDLDKVSSIKGSAAY